MSVSWSYFNKFDNVMKQYLPDRGEGNTLATQIVTAVNKLIYKWYNDGDVFDNTGNLQGWCNDLSGYANWLYKYVPITKDVLERIFECEYDEEYEDLLKDLADYTLDEELLKGCDSIRAQGSIYNCKGGFRFIEEDEEENEVQ